MTGIYKQILKNPILIGKKKEKPKQLWVYYDKLGNLTQTEDLPVGCMAIGRIEGENICTEVKSGFIYDTLRVT